MQTFRVELGANAHEVHVGENILDATGTLALAAGLKPARCAIVTDSNVRPLYAGRLEAALKGAGFASETIEVPAGESSKSPETLAGLYDRMVAAGLDRSGVVFALGGGVVGDLAGFAAATFLRGIAIVQVPTTVTAQVDSSLGGKTGINHRLAKNLIGAIWQPRAIIADISTLVTLANREFREGLAEVIKYGAIMDAAMIADLERDLDEILARRPAMLEAMVARSLRHKADVVATDERESGLRKTLNFGHTVGHALEASAGYGAMLHGEAVAIGMVAAARLSAQYAGLSADNVTRLERLIARAGLPTAMPANWRSPEFMRAMNLDKKRTSDVIEFVMLDRIGHTSLRKISVTEIVASLG
jgi:3-dehydroquinate synthase